MIYAFLFALFAISATSAIIPVISPFELNAKNGDPSQQTLWGRPESRHYYPWDHHRGSHPSSGWCNEWKFYGCIRQFTAEIGVPLKHNATEWGLDLQERYTSGNLSFTDFCIAKYHYDGCLGEGGESCFTLDNLGRLGLTPINALVYYTIGKKLSVQCANDVFPIIVRNEKCLVNTTSSKMGDIKQCAIKYSTSVIEHPDKLCSYAKQYEDCYSDLYNGCSSDSPYAVCRIFAVSFDIGSPQCHAQLKCTKTDAEDEDQDEFLSQEDTGAGRARLAQLFMTPEN